MLIEVPSERVKVIDHQHVQWTSEMVWERHGVKPVNTQGEFDGAETKFALRLCGLPPGHRPRGLSVWPKSASRPCIPEAEDE